MINIGTSGWSYKHWDKSFYGNIPAAQRLSFYSQQFQTVEINTTFYHLPTEKAVKSWEKTVPKNFLFSIKASRYITHIKRLNEGKDKVENFLKNISFLKKKEGPILFQLPPAFSKNFDRLKEFISYLPKKHLYTFEFRHKSWFSEDIYVLLKNNNISLCISDLNGTLSPIEVTGNFVYIRLHGPKSAYQDSYSNYQLKKWAARIQSWNQEKIKVFCYFDNDEKGYAIQDARRLKQLLKIS